MCAKPVSLTSIAGTAMSALVVMSASFLPVQGDALAQQSAITLQRQSPLGATELERAFWTCDYVATTRGVYAAPIELCSAVTERLKNEKFSGDFGELLEWWKANKIAVHREMACGVSCEAR